MDFYYVAAGGFLGAILRYFLNITLNSPSFPYATFLINLTGSFVIGLVLVFSVERLASSPQFRLFFAVGLLGAFTTFSTYTLESIKLLSNGKIALALYYYLGSAILGILLAAAGAQIAHLIIYRIDNRIEKRLESEREK